MQVLQEAMSGQCTHTILRPRNLDAAAAAQQAQTKCDSCEAGAVQLGARAGLIEPAMSSKLLVLGPHGRAPQRAPQTSGRSSGPEAAVCGLLLFLPRRTHEMGLLPSNVLDSRKCSISRPSAWRQEVTAAPCR